MLRGYIIFYHLFAIVSRERERAKQERALRSIISWPTAALVSLSLCSSLCKFCLSLKSFRHNMYKWHTRPQVCIHTHWVGEWVTSLLSHKKRVNKQFLSYQSSTIAINSCAGLCERTDKDVFSIKCLLKSELISSLSLAHEEGTTAITL